MGKIRAQAIEQSNQGNVVAVFDTDRTNPCPYKAYPSPEDIFSDPQIDAVFICTPNYQIAPLCIAALKAGKHVFAEKPPALNAQEIIIVRQAEALCKKKLMYGFNHRHHGSIQKMKSIIESNEMGKILWMRGRYGKEIDAAYFDGWRANPQLAGGGIMLDQGIHMLDLFIHFAGEFDEIYSLVSNLFWKMEGLEDNVFSIMRNNTSGICASLHSTMTQWRYLFSLEIFLERGALILNGLKTSSGAYGDENLAIKHNPNNNQRGEFESEQQITYHVDESWNIEVNSFFNSIIQDTDIRLGNSNDALHLMRAIDKIYESKPSA